VVGEREEPDLRGPSKSQRKREVLELQELGEELAKLPDEQLASLDLPENLLDALLVYRRTPTHGGQRRQMQYIGKLMRGVEPEPIRAALAALGQESAADTAALHRAEEWRTRLLAGEDAIDEFVAVHPETDVRKLRSLVRVARTPAPEATLRRARRELFRFLRKCVG